MKNIRFLICEEALLRVPANFLFIFCCDFNKLFFVYVFVCDLQLNSLAVLDSEFRKDLND